METVTTRADDTVDYVGSNTTYNKAGPIEDTDLFNKIFDEGYGHYQKEDLTEEIDQLSAKLALAIPE